MNEQEKKEWMLYVSCPTFNHASYIVEAMNGFSIQETNFPFICGIIDDASTDGEQEVIKNYLHNHFDLEDKKIVRHEETDDYILTFARHKTNLNCHFAVFYLKYNHYSIKKPKIPYFAQWCDNAKYYAVCEGDDYWISPQKLQMQVDVLESSPEYTMVYTGFKTIDEGGEELFRPVYDKFQNDSRTGWVFSRLLNQNFILTNTVCFRNYLLSSPLYLNATFTMDYSKFLLAASYGKAYYIEEKMSCYRKVSTGTMATRNEEVQKMLRKIHDYYSNAYLDNKIILLPFKERLSVDISLTHYYLALLLLGQDKQGLFTLFKKKPICLLLFPISIICAIYLKITKPGYSFVI